LCSLFIFAYYDNHVKAAAATNRSTSPKKPHAPHAPHAEHLDEPKITGFNIFFSFQNVT
jgi:hypothetical protein